MKILVIEDNPLKRKKIAEFLVEEFSATILEAASFNGGLNLALSEDCDIMVLDMSMPTFDRTDTTHGGRFRTVAGKDIASKLFRMKKIFPFVVLTGYKDFDVNSENLSIEQIDDSLRALGGHYRGFIMFDAAESLWKERLSGIVKDIEK